MLVSTYVTCLLCVIVTAHNNLNPGTYRTVGNSGIRRDAQARCQTPKDCNALPQPPPSKDRKKMKIIFEWEQLDFDYENERDRLEDIKNGVFVPGKMAPIDVDVYYGRQTSSVFVTVPRFLAGVPATLGTVVSSKQPDRSIIKPYPSWKWHRSPEKCAKDRMVSVFRVKVDSCGRLWVLDTGRLQSVQICPMQVLAFDLKTDRLAHRKEIPASVLKEDSILVTPIVEILNNDCQDVFVYMADTVAFSIVIHDARKGTFWSVSDRTMYPYPNYSSFDVAGDKFDLVDGILGMELGHVTQGQDRKLFYHALSSVTENWVYTSFLRNQSLFGEYPWVHPEVFHVYEGTRRSQSAAQAIDRNGISFFGQLSEPSINCWNTATEFGPQNIDLIEYDQERLQFPSGIKVINNPAGDQELWVLTSRLQKVIVGTLHGTDVNFRILGTKVNDALVGTKCVGNTLTRTGRRWY